MKYRLAATAFALTACAIVQPVSKNCTLILKPQLTSGSHSQAVVAPYSSTSIHHVKLDLSTLNGETLTSLGIQRTLLQAQLENPIVFSNLKPNTTYRISAKAYADAGESQLISTDDSRCYVNVTLTNNDRPTIETIPIQLIDRAFNGQASSSLAINPGGYSPIGSESLKYQGVQGVVTSIAGNGATGSVDGFGTAATIDFPNSITLDAQGNVYTTEFNLSRIRKISATTGEVTTVAGNGTKGFVNGIGTEAVFNTPYGLVFDSQGYLYVSEAGNQVIRKISPTNEVTTFAGCGTAGYVDANGTLAAFKTPGGMAIDAQDNIYVVEQSGHRLRKISPTGEVTTIAGSGLPGGDDGAGTSATFNGPRFVTLDAQANIYVTDQGGQRIRKVTQQGTVTTLYGNGTANPALFKDPCGIVVDSRGYIYLADRGYHRIREISPSGVFTTIAGNGATGFSDGSGYAATFNQPIGLIMDAQGALYTTDAYNNRIRKIQ